MSFKNIAVFKNQNKEEGSNQPDYQLVASWKDGEEWKSVTVGSLWKGEGNGPALKGSMKDSYTNSEGKEFPAFVIKREGDAPAQPVAPPTAADEINPDDVPF